MKSKIGLLTRTMFKAEDIVNFNVEKKGRIPTLLKYVGMLLILLLAGVSFAPMIAEMYPLLAMMGMQTMLLKLLLYIAALLVMFFAFFYVMSIFYFSSDIENYLYLPVSPGSLVLARFALVYFYEVLTTIVLFYPSFVIFGYLDRQGAAFYLTSLLTLVILPLMPLAIMSILCMVVMRFSKLFRNKDRFTLISSILGMFLALASSNFMGRMTTSINGQLPPLFQEGSTLSRILAAVFPAVTFMNKAILGTPLDFLINLAITLLISGAALLVFYYLGNLLYIDGAKGLKESGAKRVILTDRQLRESTRRRPAVFALASKEVKMLLRTPVYFINCVLVTLILPVFFLLPLFLGPGADVPVGAEIPDLLELARQFATPDVVILGITSVMGLYSGLNVISATAISREGSNFSFMKYIPVPYRTQLIAKMIPSFLVEAAGLVILLVPLVILIRPSVSAVLLGLLLGSLLTLLFNLCMLILDVLKPVLNWTSEQRAVKQNFNSAISSILSMFLSAVPLVLYYVLKIDLWIYLGVLFVVMLAASLILLKRLPGIAERSFADRP